jgi:hypothetical protein
MRERGRRPSAVACDADGARLSSSRARGASAAVVLVELRVQRGARAVARAAVEVVHLERVGA